jgi:hypothetical protein
MVEPRRVLAAALALLAVAFAVLVELQARGVHAVVWGRQPLAVIVTERGGAFAAPLGHDRLSAVRGPSAGEVWENGVRLGPGNADHDRVRTAGAGSYCYWQDFVLFTASDNTDPRSNGRRYEARYPAAVPRELRLLAVALGLFAALALANALLRRTTGSVVPRQSRTSGPLVLRASFATGAAVFAIALLVHAVNFRLHFRDPQLALTSFSILGAPASDAQGWDLCGESIAVGQGMLAYWPAIRPGYAIFLALFYTWLGANHVVGVLLNLGLVALTAALIVRIGETLGQRCAGVLAALAFAAQQTTLDNSLTLGTETLGLFLSVWSLAALCRGLHTGRRGAFLLAGVLFGLSNLTRPLTLPALPVLLLCIAWPAGRPRDFRRPLMRTAVFAAGLALVLGPWLVRQRLVCGVATLSANSAEAIYAATSPRYRYWTGAVSTEPGPEVQTIRQRYDWYMSRARENLRTDPWFYAHNVSSSYAACFAQLAAAVRGPLGWLGLVLIVLLHWRGLAPGDRRLAGTLALVPLGMAFCWLARHGGAAFHLPALLALPLVTCRRAGVLFGLALLFSILGIALFGMDARGRLGFLLEWAFLLTPLVVLGGCCLRLHAWLNRFQPVPLVPEDSPGPAPLWFAYLRGAVGLFLLAGAVRLGFLNATVAVPAPASCALTTDEALAVLRGLNARFPGCVQPGELTAGNVLTHLPGDRPTEGDGRLLVLPCRLSRAPFRLPGGVVIPHWSRYFAVEEWDRTVCEFQLLGVPFPRHAYLAPPVLFRGLLPDERCGKECLLVCRVRRGPNGPGGEAPPYEGIALIPQGGAPCLADAHVPGPLPHSRATAAGQFPY